MRVWVPLAVILLLAVGVLLFAQSGGDPLMDGFKTVEVASVADAMEVLYGQRAYMSHDMRPLFKTKFAGPAVTVQMEKVEHTEGSAVSKGMLDAIDNAPAGSVRVRARGAASPSGRNTTTAPGTGALVSFTTRPVRRT